MDRTGSVADQFSRIQVKEGNLAAIEFLHSIGEAGRKEVLEGVEELILTEFIEDRSLNTEAISRALVTWPIREDYRIAFKARVAAIEGNLNALESQYAAYLDLLKSGSLDPYHISIAAYHFGISFQTMGDRESAIYNFEQCLRLLDGTGHSDCEERLALLKRKLSDDSSDPFAILGLSRDASDEEIKTAYHQLLFQHHPDRVATMGADIISIAECKTKAINSAHEQIRRSRRRAA